MTKSGEILEEGQEEAIRKIHTELSRKRKGLVDRRHRAGGTTDEHYYDNVLGVLGRRGAGKSTVLAEQYRRMQLPGGLLEIDGRLPLVLSPLDCTALPADIVPGAAVLIHLQESLKSSVARARLKNANDVSEFDAHLKALDSVIGTYSRTTKAFLELCLDLSTSPKDFGHYFASGVRDRMRLSQEIAGILHKLGNLLRFDLVLILLDDFDLVPADCVRRWLSAFLDDLHQEQILFIITADFHRLEYLSWSAEDQVDDKTGRALLGKIIPPVNRFELRVWPETVRSGFIPRSGPDIPLGTLLDEVDIDFNASNMPKQTMTAWRLFLQLLPELPRGLHSFHAALHRRLHPEEGQAAKVAFNDYNELLKLLAAARQEPLVARRLGDVPVEIWAGLLKMVQRSVDEIEWHQMVKAASLRYDARALKLDALEALIPAPPPAEARGGIFFESQKTSNEAKTIAQARYRHDPQWQDPLRHDHLRLLPLRDVADKDLPLMTELLLDLGFGRNITQRLAFVFSWPALAERVDKFRIRLEMSRTAVEEFFSDNYGSIRKEIFGWLDFRSEEDNDEKPFLENERFKVAIGFKPLLEAFRGGRDMVPWSLLDLLRIGRGWQAEAPTVSGTEPQDRSNLLPGAVSAMILFVEGLNRCPWIALSGRNTQPLVVYLAVSCSFVKEAFWWALCKSNQNVSPPDKPKLISFLISRNSMELRSAEGSKADLITYCWSFLEFRIPLSEEALASPVGLAFSYFLQSPYYTAVWELLEEQPEVLWLKAQETPKEAEP